MHKISWNDSIWFSDIDDTLITTSESSFAAADGIKEVFTARFGEETGARVQQEFMNVFNTMLDLHRGTGDADTYTNLIQEIEDYQKNLPPAYGKPKLWSREIFITIAARRLGLAVSGELVQEATDAYWLNLTQMASIVPGALELIAEIRNHHRPLYLVTGSDARLKQQANGQFTYDPQYSEGFKRERIALLRNRRIDFNLVSIGDPEDKPHRDFFDKAIRLAEEDLGKRIDLSKAIMIGDSYTADLQTPKEQMGFGFVILFQPGKEGTDFVDDHQITTGNIYNAIKYLIR